MGDDTILQEDPHSSMGKQHHQWQFSGIWKYLRSGSQDEQLQ